ncbi:hypothetical protein F4818DRAFT_451060 [Hypoxylon cercidicola]|nr:hypothetical protein F4818DRAFT_451060 [Hypoxylon cercidicola]
MGPKNTQAAVKARERGNELYKKGLFSEAVKAYDKAAGLTPDDPAPVSNLSAANFEAGRYAECVDLTVKALGLLKPDPGTDVVRQRLLVRQAKACLHQSKLDEAEKLMVHIKSGKDLESLHGSLKGLREFDAISSQPRLLRELLLQLPRMRPSIQDELPYYGPGHDEAESVYTDALRDSSANDPVLSIMFCGVNDARNLFQTSIRYMSSPTKTQKLHITMLDIKPAVMARDLIFFSLMNESADVNLKLVSKTMIWLSLTYIYLAQILPPFAWEKLQETISKLVDSLEKKKQPLSFAYIPVSQMDSITRVLKSWQQGPATEYKTSEVRRAIARLADQRAAQFPMSPEKRWSSYPECSSDHEVFDEFGVMFPPTEVLSKFEPELSALAADFRTGTKGVQKRIHYYLDKHWKANVTFVDADWQATQPPGKIPHLGQDPIDIAKDLNNESPELSPTERKKSPYCLMNYTSKFFAVATRGILGLRDRLTIEIIVGDMVDILERLRYGHLDRYSQDRVAGEQESSSTAMEWPQKYHFVHMSNIPDYTGGSLMKFLYAGPVLKEGDGTGMVSCVMRNPPQWKNIDHFNAEYLIMYDRATIQKHFQVKLSKSTKFHRMSLPYCMSYYHGWARCQNGASPLEQLMPQPRLSKWLLAHFLKICLPFPRPAVYDDNLVYAPNNLTVFMRLLVQMAEVGYPGHWLSSIITSLSSGSVTTTARAPQKYVLDRAAVDAVYPSRTMSVKPWTAEFTTLVTMWRGVLPFAVVTPSGILPSPEIITEYSIYIPPHRSEEAHQSEGIEVPHFTLVFWNDGKYDKPPRFLRPILLDDEEGDTTTSAQKIRSDGIVMLGTFKCSLKECTATFWLRSDVVDVMLKEDWKICIWRIDAWTPFSRVVSMKNALQRKRTWKECVTSP